MRTAFRSQSDYKERLLNADRTVLSSWSEGSSKILDMVEQSCFGYDGQENASLRTGLKQGKTPQEIVEEYNPWRTLIEEIDVCLAAESTALKSADAAADEATAPAAAPAAPAAEKDPKFVLAADEGVDLTTVEESWGNFVDRQISKYVALVVEKGLSQGQLSKHEFVSGNF